MTLFLGKVIHRQSAGDSNPENTRGVLQPMEVTLHGLPMVCTVNTEKLKGMGIGVGVTE